MKSFSSCSGLHVFGALRWRFRGFGLCTDDAFNNVEVPLKQETLGMPFSEISNIRPKTFEVLGHFGPFWVHYYKTALIFRIHSKGPEF